MSNVKILSVHLIVGVSLVMSRMTTINLALTMTSAKGTLIAVIFNQRNCVFNCCVGVLFGDRSVGVKD